MESSAAVTYIWKSLKPKTGPLLSFEDNVSLSSDSSDCYTLKLILGSQTHTKKWAESCARPPKDTHPNICLSCSWGNKQYPLTSRSCGWAAHHHSDIPDFKMLTLDLRLCYTIEHVYSTERHVGGWSLKRWTLADVLNWVPRSHSQLSSFLLSSSSKAKNNSLSQTPLQLRVTMWPNSGQYNVRETVGLGFQRDFLRLSWHKQGY